MDRREELLDLVTDQVLRTGLIGLTLRPLARAVGTSDRMLIYHFGTRDALVSHALERACDRGVEVLEGLPAPEGVRAGVNRLWEAYRTAPLHPLLTVYHQAAATGLLGQEPYLSRTRASNARWAASLHDYLGRCGAPPARVGRVGRVVDSALYGFHLELVTSRPDELAEAVDDLARAAEALGG